MNRKWLKYEQGFIALTGTTTAQANIKNPRNAAATEVAATSAEEKAAHAVSNFVDKIKGIFKK